MSHFKRQSAVIVPAIEALRQSSETALSLEAVGAYLRTAKPHLNVVALKIANLAIEALSQTPALRAAPLVFSFEGLEGDPQAVVDQGVEAIHERIESAWGEVDGCLAKVMSAQVDKMAAFKNRAEALRGSVDDLTARLGGMPATLQAKTSVLEASPSLLRLSSSARGWTPCAADVNPVIDALLVVHGSAFKRVVSEKVKWLQDNQRELVANVNVFTNFQFDPNELVMLNATAGEPTPQGTAPYRSEELPGGYVLSMHLPTGVVTGLDGVAAMKSVHFEILEEDLATKAEGFNVLMVSEAKTLLNKVMNSMGNLGQWYGSIYQDLWCNDEYGGLLCEAVVRGLKEGAGAREFKDLAITILYLMHSATVDVDTYVFEVLEAQVAYLHASLQQYE